MIKKSTENKKILGVLGGLAEHFKIDPTALRLAYFAFGVFRPEIAVILYFGAALIMD